MSKPISLKNHWTILSFVLIIFTFFTQSINAQKISSSDRKKLEQKEDSLKILAADIILDSFTAKRMRSDSQLTKTFIRALQIKNSFYYPFDSVQGVSKLYAPDSAFRILTWNITFTDYYARQRGAIQMRTSDGSLKLIPLRDFSEFTRAPMDSARSKNNWIGAVYYNIIKTTYNGKNFYTMIGFDYNSAMSNKKWIEVMSFDNTGEPVFGANRFFSYEKDSIKKYPACRFSLEYKKTARAILQYEPELNMILVDHLISETDEPENKWTYVPDGDYEAFTWQGGQWVHINKLYNFKLKEGEAPIGDPLLDSKGNRNEEKLQQQSEKNKQKKKDGDND